MENCETTQPVFLSVVNRRARYTLVGISSTRIVVLLTHHTLCYKALITWAITIQPFPNL
jgi:hypothetical protein